MQLPVDPEVFRAIVESTFLCVKVFDKDRTLVFINQGGREEHCLPDNQDISKWDWVATVKKEYRAEAIEKFNNAFQKGETGRIQFEHVPGCSLHTWCSSIITPLKDDHGNVKWVLFISDDVTSLKDIESKLEQRVRERTNEL